jgi:hypothetical protein
MIWPRALAIVALMVLMRGGSDASAQSVDSSPCNSRIVTQAEFPPVAAQSLVLTPATLKILAGNKGWGLVEDVTIEPPGDVAARIVLAVRLPKGSIDHKNPDAPMGGMGFRWQADIAGTATMACLTYRLKLPRDFQFNKGGKLPGLFGGDGPAGGKDVDGASGFSARLMWRQHGAGEVYAYIPGKPDGRGLSIDRGAWTFPRGRWVELQQEIVLNTPNVADGVVRIWLDGQLRLERRDMLFRTTPSLGFAGVMADIFYGGKTAEWAAPQDAIIRLTPFELGWR